MLPVRFLDGGQALEALLDLYTASRGAPGSDTDIELGDMNIAHLSGDSNDTRWKNRVERVVGLSTAAISAWALAGNIWLAILE